MKSRVLRILAGLVLAAAGAGCIVTAERTGDRAESVRPGFWSREGLALKRVCTSPVPVVSCVVAPYRVNGISRLRATALAPTMAVWGCVEAGEEFAVGVAEMLCGCQFRSCSYPMERFRLDVADWQAGAPAPGASVAARAGVSVASLSPAARRLEARIESAADDGNWKRVADLCRERLAASSGDLDRIGCGVRLAVANWNAGDRIGAVIAMDMVVSRCSRLGPGAERAAEEFRAQLRDGDGSERFPVGDVLPDSIPAVRIVEEARR